MWGDTPTLDLGVQRAKLEDVRHTPAQRRLMRIEGQLERLIGAGASALFRDARRLANEGFGLEAQGTLVWHCAREIESAIRDALRPVAPIDAVASEGRIHAAEIEAIIEELDLDATVHHAIAGTVNPARWSGAGVKVLSLPPNYLERYLSGLRESAKDGATLNGNALVRLFQAAMVTGQSWLGDEHQDVRRSVAWILRDGLGGDRFALSSSAARTDLWAVIGALMTDPSEPTMSSAGGDADDLAIAALNHTRSISTSVIVAYALWLSRHHTGPRRLMPEAQRLLEERLDTDEALEVRFSIGEHLVALHWLDSAWTDALLPRVFPTDEASAMNRDAAWRGFLWRGQVPLDLFVTPLSEYRHAIEVLDPAKEATSAHRRLAEHVLLLARLGTIAPDSGDGLLPLLFSRAGDDLGRQAIHDLGWWLYSVRDEPSDHQEVARLMALWEWLASEVEAGRATPSSLEPFGWWFASGRFDRDWSLDELERLARADVEIDFMHIVYERLLVLVPDNPERVGRATEAIVAHEVRPDDLHGMELPAIVRVLIDSASGAEANASGQAIIGMMVSRGFARFPADSPS